MKTEIVGVIFSLSEGFFKHDDSTWVQDPKDATHYHDIVTWSRAPYADNAYNVAAKLFSQITFDDLREKLVSAICLHAPGLHIARDFSALNGDTVSYEGDDIWLVNDRSCDYDDMKEMVSEISSGFTRKELAGVYDDLSDGYVWFDDSEGFIHCSEKPFSY